MPNEPDPSSAARVIVAPGAQQVFQAIDNDQSLSGAAAPAASTAAPTTPPATVAPSTIAVTVENGSGVQGRAASLTTHLRSLGFQAQDGDNASPTATTRLVYASGKQAAAQTVARTLGLPASDLSATGTSSSVLLVIGSDWPSGTTLPATAASSAPTALPSSANVLNVGAAPGCVHVSTDYTLPGETPIQAYSRNPRIPDSDSAAARQM
jgi:hypothetical protein